MFVRKYFLGLSVDPSISFFQFGNAQLFSCAFGNFFIRLFEKFPNLNRALVSGDKFVVFSLSLQPLNAFDLLIYLHASEGVKLIDVRLKFSEVVVAFAGFLGLVALENDDPASFVPNCDVLAIRVELECSDDVFF